MKLRRLVFDDTKEGRERYTLLWQGFLTGGNSAQTKGIEVVRREAKILDKFAAHGTIPPDVVSAADGSDELARSMNPGDQTIDLEQPEYEMLKRYFESTPWVTRMSVRVRNVSDWLNSIQLEDHDG